jgi:hypothetical protein
MFFLSRAMVAEIEPVMRRFVGIWFHANYLLNFT